MKIKYILAGSLAFLQFVAKSQSSSDTVREKVNKTQIDIVYNNYIQDGNNSAITGGVGNEQLTVYGPSIRIGKILNNNTFKVNLGVDIISSASADSIDFIISSASASDTRGYINSSYEHYFEKKNSALYGGIGTSIESDYLSIESKLGFLKEYKEKLTQFSIEFNVYSDDLRWGRRLSEKETTLRLIYPKELRYKEWYDEYKRFSFNLKLGYTKVINKRSIIGFFPLITYQKGLLATPFHRVFFSNKTLGVEQLPNQRVKGSIAFILNYFAGGNLILKNKINPYIDNFGISGFSIENETAIKLNPIWTLLPNIRFYSQKGSPYFSPYKKNNASDIFFTSDYDLSTFRTYTMGIGVKYKPSYRDIKNIMQFNRVIFRYNFMYRTNRLSAHILSLNIQMEWDRKNTHE